MVFGTVSLLAAKKPKLELQTQSMVTLSSMKMGRWLFPWQAINPCFSLANPIRSSSTAPILDPSDIWISSRPHPTWWRPGSAALGSLHRGSSACSRPWIGTPHRHGPWVCCGLMWLGNDDSCDEASRKHQVRMLFLYCFLGGYLGLPVRPMSWLLMGDRMFLFHMQRNTGPIGLVKISSFTKTSRHKSTQSITPKTYPLGNLTVCYETSPFFIDKSSN